MLCDSDPGNITFGTGFLRLAELSQSTSGCGNRCAKAKPLFRPAGASRDIVYTSRGVIYCDDIWHLTASVARRSTNIETSFNFLLGKIESLKKLRQTVYRLRERVCARWGSTVLSRSLCSSPIVTNHLVICLHAWSRHPLRTLYRAIPRWKPRFDLHTLRSSAVWGGEA
jgi:hypothetical protein